MAAFIMWTVIITALALAATLTATNVKRDWTKGQKMKRAEQERKEHERIRANHYKALQDKRNDTAKTMVLWDQAWQALGGGKLPAYARTNRVYLTGRGTSNVAIGSTARMENYNAIIGTRSSQTVQEIAHGTVKDRAVRAEFEANLEYRLGRIYAMPHRSGIERQLFAPRERD